MRVSIRKFFQLESASALILFACTLVALILSNSPWGRHYDLFLLKTHILHMTNEGLMSVFFLLVGLEIKYELFYGALNSVHKALLPGIAAVGGMLVPALIYVLLNQGDRLALQGWAVPSATDIAFSLGVLTLLGSRIPISLKIFLMALAIFDDLAAIVIIAVFYTEHIFISFLGWACMCIVALIFLNRKKVDSLIAYGVCGLGLWYCLFRAGVHPTLAGGILAFLMPLRSSIEIEKSSFLRLKYSLHPWVAFGILPLFALANAGIPFLAVDFNHLEVFVVLGIFLGLFLGKPLGIFGFCWLCVKFRLAQLPDHMRWFDLFALSVLCGMGFTISLFIGTLAFGDYDTHLLSVKLGVLLGTVFSGLLAYGLLLRR